MNTNSIILGEFVSEIDNKTPIVVIATGLNYSSNRKTGSMIQTYILLQDVSPIDAVKSGQDYAICGDCRFSSGNGCYVNIAHGPTQIWKAYKRGSYRMVTKNDWNLFSNRKVRIGSYGDPGAVPYIVWFNIIKRASGYTGYTHRRKHLDARWNFLMVSTDTEEERLFWQDQGARTFNTLLPGEPIPSGEILCPATMPDKNVTCQQCMLCAGTNSGSKNINVVVHGPSFKVNRAIKAKVLVDLQAV